MRELFIYYQTTLTNADVLQTTVQALQARFRALHPGLQTRLMRRPEPSNGLHTWMETYALPLSTNGISDSLLRDIEAQAETMLATLLASPRHIEGFVSCV